MMRKKPNSCNGKYYDQTKQKSTVAKIEKSDEKMQNVANLQEKAMNCLRAVELDGVKSAIGKLNIGLRIKMVT